MKYLCLGYYDAERFDTLTEAEQEAIASECQRYDEALRKSGHLVAVASLQHRAASLHPAANWGEHLGFAVEVRPIEFFEQLQSGAFDHHGDL
jgi:hypothetical protein